MAKVSSQISKSTLQLAREKARLTQVNVSRIMERDSNTISRWETQKNPITRGEIMALALLYFPADGIARDEFIEAAISEEAARRALGRSPLTNVIIEIGHAAVVAPKAKKSTRQTGKKRKRATG